MKKETIKRLFGNFVSLSTARISTAFLYFLLLIYLARVLGVEAFGKYEFSIAFFALFDILAIFGIDKIGTRTIARFGPSDTGKIKQFTNELVSLKFLTSLASFVMLVLIALVIPKPYDVKMLIILNGIVILFTFLSVEWFFMAREEMHFVAISRIINAGLFLIMTLVFVKASGDLFRVPCVRIIAAFLSAIFLVYIYSKKWGPFRPEYNFKVWKDLAKTAFPVLASGLMVTIYVKLDALMLGFMKSNRDVGLYVAVYRIVLFFTSMRLVAVNAVFPALSKFFVDSKEELNDLVRISQKLAIMIALPIGAGAAIMAPRIINLLYGPMYAAAVPAFQILIWVFVVQSINFIFPQLQIACNRQKTYLRLVSVGVLLNIILNILLIPRYGINGAAIATIAADIVSLVLFCTFSRDIVKVDLITPLIKPFLSVCLMCIAVISLKNANMFFLIFTGAFIYFFSLVMMGHVKKSEFLHFWKALVIK